MRFCRLNSVSVSICIVFAAFFCLFITSDCNAGSSEAKKNAKNIWKAATLAPDGVGWAVHVKEMLVPAVTKISNGELYLDIYWGGIMGDEEDYIAKMRIDQLQATGVTGCGGAMICPETSVISLPFLFKDYNEVDYVLPRLRPSLEKLFIEQGFKMLVLTDEDFTKVYSVKYKFNTLDDFTNSRFITWYGPMEAALLKTLGASPIPVNVPEITASMRAGVCDSFIAPAIWVVGSQLYTVLKHVNPINLRYSPVYIIVTLKAWNQLSDAYEKAFIAEVAKLEHIFSQKIRESNEKCYNAMVKYGVKEVVMSDEETEIIRKKVMPLWNELAGDGKDKLYPKELLDEITGYLDEYHKLNK